MKTFAPLTVLFALFGLFAGFPTAQAASEPKTLCKSSYAPADQLLFYTNTELDQRGEANYETDCVDLFVKILQEAKLPEMNGGPVPVRLYYVLPQDDLFPTIEKLLAAHQDRTLKLEIRFSLPGEFSALDPDMTDITVTVTERGPELR